MFDRFGILHKSTDEICESLYLNPSADLAEAFVDDPDEFNNSVRMLHCEEFLPILKKYAEFQGSVEEFDKEKQSIWHMPDEYKKLDIAKWLLDQCQNEEELQRVGKELLMFQERGLFVVLQFLKYFVDTMRKNNVVWGVGRGSSVASYCLFLLGVHKINSLYYDLPIEEFLK